MTCTRSDLSRPTASEQKSRKRYLGQESLAWKDCPTVDWGERGGGEHDNFLSHCPLCVEVVPGLHTVRLGGSHSPNSVSKRGVQWSVSAKLQCEYLQRTGPLVFLGACTVPRAVNSKETKGRTRQPTSLFLCAGNHAAIEDLNGHQTDGTNTNNYRFTCWRKHLHSYIKLPCQNYDRHTN